MDISISKIKKVLKKKIELSTLLKVSATIVSILILWFLYRKGIIAVAFVNGEPITLGEIMRVMQEEGGPKNAIDKVIAEKIIEYEAKKRNIVVKQEEIDREIKSMEAKALENGKTLIQLMKENNQTTEELQKNVKLRITLYKILAEDVEVTDDEIDNFIDKNRDIYKDQEREQIREEVKQLLISQKIDAKYEIWIKDARANTDIEYFIKTK